MRRGPFWQEDFYVQGDLQQVDEISGSSQLLDRDF